MKIVIVTGASSGLGRGFSEALGARKDLDEIWVIARRTERLEELKNTISAKVVPISLDLSCNECIEKYRQMLADQNPEVIALVNAAGFGRFGEFENITLSDQMGMIDLNVAALTAVTYETLPYLAQGAEVYQIASFSAFLPLPYVSVYAATKSYVLSFSRSLRVELANRKIRVMAVCPKWVRTEFFDRAAEQPDVVTYYDRFYTVDQVVTRALRDMKRGKDVSTCGIHARTEARLLKILPPKLAMKIWCWQQKK